MCNVMFGLSCTCAVQDAQYRGGLSLFAPYSFHSNFSNFAPSFALSSHERASSILELNLYGAKRIQALSSFNVFPSGPVWRDTVHV